MARNDTVKLALAAALAAAFLVIPVRASAQGDDYDASYVAEYDGYDAPYLAEYYDEYGEPYLADVRSRGRDDARRWRSPYGYRRFDRDDTWRWRTQPYRYRRYDRDDYFYGRPWRDRYQPYRYRYYDPGNYFFGWPLSYYGDSSGADELLAEDFARGDYGYGGPWGSFMRPSYPYRNYGRDDSTYGRPWSDDYYRGRTFDRDDAWRWRTRPEQRREFDRDYFNRGFEPEERNRAFGRERSEGFFGRPRENEGMERERGGEGGRGFENRQRIEGGGGKRGFQRQGSLDVPQQAPVGEYASEEETYVAPDEGGGTYDQPGRTDEMGESEAYGNSNWKDQPWKSESGANTTMR